MKLDTVELTFGITHRGVRCALTAGEADEAGRRCFYMVAVTHPDFFLEAQCSKQTDCIINKQSRRTKFADMSGSDFAAEGMRQ